MALILLFVEQKKDEPNKKGNVQLLRVDHSPFPEHFDTYRPINADLESDSFSSISNVTPLRSRHDESRSSFDSRESTASADSYNPSNRSGFPASHSEGHLRRARTNANMQAAPPADVVQLRKQNQDVSAYRARHVRSEYYGDRDFTPVRLPRPKSLDALNKIIDNDSTLLPELRVQDNINNASRTNMVQTGSAPLRRELQFASSTPATPTGARRSPPRQTSSPRVSSVPSPRASPKSSPTPQRKFYPSPPPSPTMSRSSVRSFNSDAVPVKERNTEITTRDSCSKVPATIPSTVVRVGATFALASPSSSSITVSQVRDPHDVATTPVSTSPTATPGREGGCMKSSDASPAELSGSGVTVDKVTHIPETDAAPIERFVREMERSKELNRGSFRGSNRSLSSNSLRGSNHSLNRVTASTSTLPTRQATTVYAVYSSTNSRKESIKNTENVVIDATGIDVSVAPADKSFSDPGQSNANPSAPVQPVVIKALSSRVRISADGTSTVPPTSNLKNETQIRKENSQHESNPNHVRISSSRPRSASGRSITSQSLTAQTRNNGDDKLGVQARVREFEKQNTEAHSIRSPSSSALASVQTEEEQRSRSVTSDASPSFRKQPKTNNHKRKDEQSHLKTFVSPVQTDNRSCGEYDRTEGHVNTSSVGLPGSSTTQNKKVSPVWYEYGCV